MEDHELDQLLEGARESYNVPPEPAVEALWQRIDAEAFVTGAPVRRGAEWRIAWRLAAASLVFGVVAGRWTAGVGAAPSAEPAMASAVLPVSGPYQQTTEELLSRSVVLLSALRSSDASGALAAQMSAQATRMLGTTRLLLDSPAASDPRMHTLLLDLEMTLAQVARLQPARGTTELTLINEAVVERDMVPRIRSAVVDLAGGGY